DLFVRLYEHVGFANGVVHRRRYRESKRPIVDRHQGSSMPVRPPQTAAEQISRQIVAGREISDYTPPWRWEAGKRFNHGCHPGAIFSFTHKGGSTMRKLSIALGLAVAMIVTVGIRAAEDKEETLKGTITCAKCDLKKEKACATAIVV